MKRTASGLLFFLAGCRACGSASPAAETQDAAVDAPEPQVDLPDAPTEMQVCQGAALDLFAALADPSCFVPEREWASVAAAGARSLAQEARREGDVIVFALVNRGRAPVRIPLRRGVGQAFSVLAETKSAGLFELASPAPLADDGGPGHVQSAVIVLAAGGRAEARLRLDRKIVARLDRRCTDCIPAALPEGAVLHVGQFVTPLDVGPPVRIGEDADASPR